MLEVPLETEALMLGLFQSDVFNHLASIARSKARTSTEGKDAWLCLREPERRTLPHGSAPCDQCADAMAWAGYIGGITPFGGKRPSRKAFPVLDALASPTMSRRGHCRMVTPIVSGFRSLRIGYLER